MHSESWRQFFHQRFPIFLGKVKRLSRENTQRRFAVFVALKIQNEHLLFTYPALALARIRELLGCDRNTRSIAHLRQRRKCSQDLLPIEMHHEIDVLRIAAEAMSHHRKPAVENERYPRLIQCSHDRLKARNFHDLRDLSRSAFGWELKACFVARDS